MDETATEDGQTIYVSRTEGDRGSKGAFYAAYGGPDRSARYGWYCAHCESLDTAMDSMGRIQCNQCGNVRKPTEWDAAHE